jgi:hypothetical protein
VEGAGVTSWITGGAGGAVLDSAGEAAAGGGPCGGGADGGGFWSCWAPSSGRGTPLPIINGNIARQIARYQVRRRPRTESTIMSFAPRSRRPAAGK